MPSKVIIDSVVATVRTLPAYPNLRVLDLSCGEGEVLEGLAADGCQVEGTHYRADDYIIRNPSQVLESVPIHTGVDLSRGLPFEDGEYDVVLATEVLEHLPNHSGICSEVGRLLKAGGFFLFSTPNIHRLQSRVQFLFSGMHELRGARLGWETPASDLYSTHYNPVYFPVMHTLLHHNRLAIRRLVFSEKKWWTVVLGLLLPLVLIGTYLECRHAVKRSAEGGGDLLRWMLDRRLLFSDQLVVLAEKATD